MVNIPKTYKYRYNGVIHTGPSVPAGAELLETTDTLDTQTYNILSLIYPVGSIYIGVQEECPLKTLISGSTWVKVSEGRVLQGSDNNHNAGTTIEAGLPNIIGSVSSKYYITDDVTTNGVFESISGTGQYGTTQSNVGYGFTFDASRSSVIYGNSNTVQPPAYVVNIWRRTA